MIKHLNQHLYSLAFLIISLLVFGCKNNNVSIEMVKSNLNSEKTYFLNYNQAYENGFIIPNENDDGITSFKVNFKVNGYKGIDTLYYKLFYQNESYKFEENDPLCAENFYGCSESTLLKFNKVAKSKNGGFDISDNIIIKGNPRNEQKYFGRNRHASSADTSGLHQKMEGIKANTEWYNEIRLKAEKNAITIEEQLESDALWTLSNEKSNKSNNRWQRNPRVGKYSLLLVVTSKTNAAKTPGYITNTTFQSGGGYENPYRFFKDNNMYHTFSVENFVTVKAEVPIASGIYIPYKKLYDKSFYGKYVNDGDSLSNTAAFEIQYTTLHKKEVKNIPIKTKFLSENYTKKEYFDNIKKYKDQRITTHFVNTESPGKTFGVDTTNYSLWFKNPYYKDDYRKENVGFKTRHGFTYGKYTFKIKMANLLTKDNVWTGLTNALWMVTESMEEWNRRRICSKEGFMPFYGAGEGEKRVPQISYSEIDFEILKTAETWPWTSYHDKQERNDPPENDDKVMLTCTNWDMACLQPSNFGLGVQTIKYDGKEFYPHRWNEYYNALTAKSPQKDTELFGGEYFYFQIEWKPKEIIWRIGPEKDKLRTVGYMNDEITTIPNNQMIAVITQEYHFAEWWPKSPYKQGNIPFPGEDLNGRLYSLEIE